MQDLERLAEHFEQEYGFQCYQIAIHRDEGYIDDDGKEVINHHAHLEFITLDKQTGKNMYRRELISPKILRQIQTEVAEILNMERGQDKRISKRERVEPRKYAQMKEAERKEQTKLKAEHKKELEAKNNVIQAKNQTLNEKLKEEWLTKKQIADLIEAKRKSMLQENKELKEANQQPIYKAENYKDLRSLGEKLKGQDITIEQLEEQIEELLQLAREKAKKEQLKEIEALKVENEALKAKNNEIKAQKEAEIEQIKQEAQKREAEIKEIFFDEIDKMEAEIKEKDNIIESQNAKIENLLTQDQIQEIINQALEKTYAEIEKKNQEIQSLKAKNLEYFGENDRLSSLNQYLQSEVDRLNKKIRDYDYTDETEDQEEYQDQTYNQTQIRKNK
jgi:hypothetical protein